ncbi:hypothetical protein AHF37_03429, partial [Paragonimus kellicotti]
SKTLAWLDEEKENLVSDLPITRQLSQSLRRHNHVSDIDKDMSVRDIARDRLFPSNRPSMQPFTSGEPLEKKKTHSFLSRLFKKTTDNQPSDQPAFGLLVKQWLLRSGSKHRDRELRVQPTDQAYGDRRRQRTEHYSQSGFPTVDVLQNQIDSDGPWTRMNSSVFHRKSIVDQRRQTVEAVPIPIVRTKSDESLIQASNKTTTHFGEFSRKFRPDRPVVLHNSSYRRSAHYPNSPF